MIFSPDLIKSIIYLYMNSKCKVDSLKRDTKQRTDGFLILVCVTSARTGMPYPPVPPNLTK